jgi:hypothetical protein
MARAALHDGPPPPSKATADPDDHPIGGESARQAYVAKRPAPVRSAAMHRHPRSDPLMSRLERLARLHQSGELSDWEFGVAKSKILRS